MNHSVRAAVRTKRNVLAPISTLPLAALGLPESVKGVTVTDSNFYGPAVAILAYDLCRAQRQIGGKKGFDGGEWFSLSLPFDGSFAMTTQHHDPHQAPR
jgi:hypothetical protein